MIERHRLPEDLETMAAGPQLAALLASVDRRALSETDQVRLVRARNRMAAHVQGELFADLYAVSLQEPPVEESPVDGEMSRYPWAQAEVAFALTWTHTAAGARLELARQLVEEFPGVLAALRAGDLDMPKVLVICELAGWLEDRDAARRVVEQVLVRAPQLTTGQLRAMLRRLVLAIDPDAARKRCALAVATRQVRVFDNADGTGEVWGRSLPPQDTAAAWERLTAIAKAAKHAGDARTMDQLRADALLDLLVGQGVAIGQPVSCHTAGLAAEGGCFDGGGHVVGSGGPPGLECAAGEVVAGATASDGDRAAGWDPQWPSRAPDEWLGPHEVWPDPTGEPLNRWDDAGQAFDGGEHWPPDWPGRWIDDPAVCAAGGTPLGVPAAAGSSAGAAAAMPAPRRGVVELQVPLTALMSLTQLPGELAGFGPVVADIARQVARAHRDGTWRFSVYSEVGGLICHGITNARPRRPGASDRVPAGPVAGGSPAAGSSRSGLSRSDRRPRAEVAAFVRARNRTCTAPGCRRPARDSDLDHIVDWAAGGASEADNLGPKCRLHHRFKHESGAQVVALGDGILAWRTPRGLQYVTAPDPPLLDDALFSVLAQASP